MTLCIYIYIYISPSVTKCHQVSPSVTKCQQVSPSVTKCQQVSASVSKCQQVSASVSKCHQVSPSVTKCHNPAERDQSRGFLRGRRTALKTALRAACSSLGPGSAAGQQGAQGGGGSRDRRCAGAGSPAWRCAGVVSLGGNFPPRPWCNSRNYRVKAASVTKCHLVTLGDTWR